MGYDQRWAEYIGWLASIAPLILGVILGAVHAIWKAEGTLQEVCVPADYRCREKEMFYLTTHSTHFIYGYMASDIWLRTVLIVRKETRCRHIGCLFLINSKGSFICTIPQTG